MNMKKTSKAKKKAEEDDLRPHYDFDYSKSKPNRFAGHFTGDSIMVSLDPDVSEVFKDAESVNTALRALLGAIPKAAKPGK